MSIGVTLLKGPQDWQIIQRNAEGRGSMQILLTCERKEHGDKAEVQARLVLQDTGAPVTRDLDWQTAVHRPDNTFGLAWSNIPTGGLYRLETRLRRPCAKDPRPLRGDCRHHLGVGDLWLIAGQSNASGTGKGIAHDPPQLGIHLFNNSEAWSLATHPLEDATDTLHPITVTGIFHGSSPWLTFAKQIFARTKVPMGLIPCALGGSPLSRWVKNGIAGDLSLNMVDMCKKANDGEAKAAGVLWYQGESDVMDASGRPMQAYAEEFKQWARWLREDVLGWSVPLLTGQLNSYEVEDEGISHRWTKMRSLQSQLSRELEAVHLVPTLDLALSDEIHNSASAQVTLGERFADIAMTKVYGAEGLPWPKLAGASWKEGSSAILTLEIEGRSGDWTADSKLSDFSLEDTLGVLFCRAVMTENRIIELHLDRSPKGEMTVHVHAGCSPRPTLRDDSGRFVVPDSLSVHAL